MTTDFEPKPVQVSKVEMTEIVLPPDTNALGTIFGGKVMHWIDIAGSIAAFRHCRRVVVTASLDRLDFHYPIRLGQIAVLKASVNYTSRTSLEVGVKVLAEDPLTGTCQQTASAYLTFVALDENMAPTPIPPVRPETPDEERRYREGAARRKARLADRSN